MENTSTNASVTMRAPPSLPSITKKRGLNGNLVDFHLLHELLQCSTGLDDKNVMLSDWAGLLTDTCYNDSYQSREEESPTYRGIVAGAWRMTNLKGCRLQIVRP